MIRLESFPEVGSRISHLIPSFKYGYGASFYLLITIEVINLRVRISLSVKSGEPRLSDHLDISFEFFQRGLIIEVTPNEYIGITIFLLDHSNDLL